MAVDATATIAGLDALARRVDGATRQLVADAIHRFQAAGMAHAPVGTPGNSTNAPGDLRRSIIVDGTHGGPGYYEAQVGPTVIYGRQRELGGDIYPKIASALHFFRFGEEIFTSHVAQDGEHYMAKGYAEALPTIEPLAISAIATAIGGA